MDFQLAYGVIALMGHWRAVSRNLSFMSRPASGYALIRSQGFEWKINFPPVGKRD